MSERKKRTGILAATWGFFLLFALIYVVYIRIIAVPYQNSSSELKQVKFEITDRKTESLGSKGTKMVVEGHFSEHISVDTQLFCKIENLEVHMKDEEGELWSYGEPGSYPRQFHSPGISWQRFYPTRSIDGGLITIELTSPYGYDAEESFQSFFNGIYRGDSAELLSKMLSQHMIEILVGAIMMISALALLVFYIVLYIVGTPLPNYLLFEAVFMMSAGFCVFNTSDVTALLFHDASFLRTLHMFCSMIAGMALAQFVALFVTGLRRTVMGVLSIVIGGVSVIGVIIQQCGIIDGDQFQGILGSLMFPAAVVGMLAVLQEYYSLKKQDPHDRNKLFIAGAVMFALCCLAESCRIVFGFEIKSKMFLDSGYALVALFQLVLTLSLLREGLRRSRRVEELEKELLNAKISMMISQIKPHFIFNTLNAIGAMCLTEPLQADTAITQFSDYLRANIMLLEGTEKISLREELAHIDNYVQMEQLRFGEKVQVEYEIEDREFEVPLLSLQPVVENAIKHGITKKTEGGCVRIHTFREGDMHVVEITDDGVGFDLAEEEKLEEIKDAENESVGIRNIRTRLEIMVNAKVFYQSAPMQGTTVRIEIPVQQER